MNFNTTRFPPGVTNEAPGSLLGDLKVPNPYRYFSYENDFSVFNAADWVVTETQAGATQAILTGAGSQNGVLALVNSAANNDLNSLQYAGGQGAVAPQFLFDATKDLFIGARISLDSANLAAFLVGLAIADTSPIASLPTDGIFISKPGGTTNPTGYIRNASGGTPVQIPGAALVDATFAQIGIAWSAVEGVWRMWVDNAQVRFALPNTPPTALLAPTIALANGSGVARTLLCDWFMAKRER